MSISGVCVWLIKEAIILIFMSGFINPVYVFALQAAFF